MVHPIPFPESESAEFWQAYLNWQGSASDEELRQLETTLACLQSQEVMPIAKAVHLALGDEQAHHTLPATLVRHLQDARWPAAHAAA